AGQTQRPRAARLVQESGVPVPDRQNVGDLQERRKTDSGTGLDAMTVNIGLGVLTGAPALRARQPLVFGECQNDGQELLRHPLTMLLLGTQQVLRPWRGRPWLPFGDSRHGMD